MAKATVTKTVRLPEPLAESLEAAAKAVLNSENAIMVAAITEYLERHAEETS